MATLKESLSADTSQYEPVDRATGVGGRAGFPPIPEGQPTINPFLRCPMPPISVTPDTLRQFYTGGQVPQFRVLTPPNNLSGMGQTGGTTVINNNGGSAVVGGTGSGTGTGTGSTPLTALAVSVTTPMLASGASFTGMLTIASKSFQLLSMTFNNPCRVEIYGTALDQVGDVGRALDIAPMPGTQQNLITDVVVDTAPYQWSWQNRTGANADAPQATVMYVTVTNIGSGSAVIIGSIVYLPLESA